MSASTNAPVVSKRTRILSKDDRAKAVLALKVAGLKNGEIAQELGVNRKTIQRDLDESKAATEIIDSQLTQLNAAIAAILPMEQRAGKYVDLATNAKNEAVSLGALQRIDDLAGIVTQKELVRTRRDEAQQPQAMFMLPPGAQIAVSVTTTCSNPTPKTVSDSAVIDVKPVESTE